MAEIIIDNKGISYKPQVCGKVLWSVERMGVPGRLDFTVIRDKELNFVEGNAVRFVHDGKNVFSGFVFSKQRNKDSTISVTSYDQLRYFKNKDTYIYENLTASELISSLAKNMNLQLGDMQDTKYKIPARIEDNKTLFDIAQTAIDLTFQMRNELFVLFDDFGRLTLKNASDMISDTLIDETAAGDYNYSSSIDSNTYNKIKLSLNNSKTGKREISVVSDPVNIGEWGILQYFENAGDKDNIKARADTLLSMYNKKTRSLTIQNALGDTSIRAGVKVNVSLNLGDIVLNKSPMLVEKVKHYFDGSRHLMDLDLRGGLFDA